MCPISVNPRSNMVNDAKIAMDQAFLAIRRKFELTPAEEIGILAGGISRITHAAIKTERENEHEVQGDKTGD